MQAYRSYNYIMWFFSVWTNQNSSTSMDSITIYLQQLELDTEQQAGSKLGKEYVKAIYCHPAYLTYMQSTSWEMPGWVKHKLESRLLRNINNLRYANDTTLMAESEEELKSFLKMREESKKAGLKLNIQELRSWHLVPSLHSK